MSIGGYIIHVYILYKYIITYIPTIEFILHRVTLQECSPLCFP